MTGSNLARMIGTMTGIDQGIVRCTWKGVGGLIIA